MQEHAKKLVLMALKFTAHMDILLITFYGKEQIIGLTSMGAVSKKELSLPQRLLKPLEQMSARTLLLGLGFHNGNSKTTQQDWLEMP